MAMFADGTDVATLLLRDISAAELDAAELLCEMASAEIQSATGQTLELVENDVAVLHGTWERFIRLPQRPVVSVSAISVNGQAVPVGTWLLAQDRIYRGHLPLFNGPDEWNNDLILTSWFGPAASVQVTYTHGFEEIPPDVKSACLSAAFAFFTNPEGFTAESIGAYAYQRAASSGGLVGKDARAALVARYSGDI